MNNQTTIWRRWSGMIFWSIVVLTVFGWLAGVADFFASALGLTDWALSYIAAFGSESDREMLSVLDTFENVATSLQFICLAAWVVYLIGLRNFREPQTSESAVEGVKSVYSACWVGIVSVALSFVGGLLPGGFRWVFTVPAWIMLLVSYIMFRSAFRGLQTESTWAERARSGAGLLRKSANYNVRLMLFPLFGLIVGAITVFVVASVLHSSQSDPRQMLETIVSVAGAEFVILAVLLLWMSVMQFVYRLMGWYRIWQNAPIAETSETEPMPKAATTAEAEPSTAATSKKRGAIIGGSVGAATVIIGMLAIFSKGCGSGDGEEATLTDSVSDNFEFVEEVTDRVEDTAAAAVSDAEMMGLKGPVERVEEWFEFSEEPKRVMTFDAEGRLTVPAGITAVRDDLGRLTKYADERTPDSEDSFTYELTYDGDGLRPVSWTSANIGSFSTTKLTFSADGDLTSAHETSNLEGDEYVYFNFTTYTILARDEHGNWTKRQADVDESFAGAELSDHVCRTYVETRKITYRK